MKGQLSLVKENVKWVRCGRVNVLMGMANCDTFTLRFFALLSSDRKTTPRTISTEDTVLTEKNCRSVEAFSETDVKTNVYKRMLRSRLPWQLDLFSSQTKTFVSETTGRIRAWKQADSCSEDLPLAIQIGQCLLLVGFNGKFAFFTVGRGTKSTMPACRPFTLSLYSGTNTQVVVFIRQVAVLIRQELGLQIPDIQPALCQAVRLSHFGLPRRSRAFSPLPLSSSALPFKL